MLDDTSRLWDGIRDWVVYQNQIAQEQAQREIEKLTGTRFASPYDMAMNYEKGDNSGYKFGEGPYTPPNYPPKAKGLAQLWEKAEAWAAQLKNTARADQLIDVAINAWTDLEACMVWEKTGSNVRNPEFRRRYIEWLASQPGSNVPIPPDPTSFDVQVPELDMNQMPILERIVQAGYRALAMQAHPDKGGSPDKFHELQMGAGQLKRILKELKDVL